MKELDRVKLIKDRVEYKKEGVKVGDKGTVMLGERNGYVLVFLMENTIKMKMDAF